MYYFFFKISLFNVFKILKERMLVLYAPACSLVVVKMSLPRKSVKIESGSDPKNKYSSKKEERGKRKKPVLRAHYPEPATHLFSLCVCVHMCVL